MALLPADLPTGLVTGQFYFVSEDAADADTDPDLTVVSGNVTFTCSAPLLRVPTKAASVIPLEFKAKFDANGQLVSASDPTAGIRLPATDSSLYNPTGFTWHVSFDLTKVSNGHTIRGLDSFDIQVPAGGTVDLTTDMPVSTSPGVLTVQGPATTDASLLSKGTVADARLPQRLQDTELNATYDRVVTANGMVGGTDCTSALQGFFTDAQAKGLPLILPTAANGQPYKVSAILQVWTGARIIGRGAVLDFQTDHTSIGRGLYVGLATGGAGISDVQLQGLKVISSNATARNGVYGLISAFDSKDVLIQDCWIGNDTANSGGESAGIFMSNTTDLCIVRPRVQNTLADGIHLSRATQRAVIDHPVVIGAQDDGISVVSNRQDGTGPIYEACKYVQINQPIIRSSTSLGNGIALIGAQDCTVNGGSVDGVPTSIVVIAQANYGGVIKAARNTISGITGTGSAFASGAFRVANADRTAITGVELSGNVTGIQVLSSSNTKITGCGVSSTGTDVGIYADTASTRTVVTGCILADNAGGALLLQGTSWTETGNIKI